LYCTIVSIPFIHVRYSSILHPTMSRAKRTPPWPWKPRA
jgi:hypothetical protein